MQYEETERWRDVLRRFRSSHYGPVPAREPVGLEDMVIGSVSGAIEHLQADDRFIAAAYEGLRFDKEHLLWHMRQYLPTTLPYRSGVAYSMVPTVMTALFGPRGEGWIDNRIAGAAWVRAIRR